MHPVIFKRLSFTIALPLFLSSCAGSSGSESSNTANTLVPAISDKALSGNAVVIEDVNPPSKPGHLRLTTPLQSSSASLEWKPSIDDVKLSGYRIYRNGEYIAFTVNTLFTDSKLNPDISYQYEIEAVDKASNTTFSDALTVTILK